MKFCCTVQSDNTMMNFGLLLNLKITKDSPDQLGSKVVIELKKITRFTLFKGYQAVSCLVEMKCGIVVSQIRKCIVI